MSQGVHLHPFYNGLGATDKSSILPNQFIPENQKGPKFQKKIMDALETIGLSQLSENIEFREFYKMTEGRLAHSDYGLEGGVLDKIKDLGDTLEIPIFVKHYDFIGIIVNQLVGEYLELKDNFTVDSIDSTSENDFIRDRTQRVHEYTQKLFDLELKKRLVQKGINPDQGDFKSQEEQQQYLATIEKEKASLMDPSKIQIDMQKNWKTKAAEWGAHVIEADQARFYLDDLDADEMKDYLLTGRWFRNYYVGYDYYKPERWSPIQTFFSKDVSAKFPQDGEYVGKIDYMSPSDIAKRWGHLMKPADIKKINTGFDAAITGNDNGVSMKSMMDSNFGEQQLVPFPNYYDNELGLQMQDAMDVPMGHYNTKDKEGNDIEVPTWLTPGFNTNYSGYRYSSIFRDDINTRTDLLQVTEAYFRSWKRMWFLNYTTEDGKKDSIIITDEILGDFIKDNDIKKISTKTIIEIKEEIEENTMYEFWIPEIWSGIKININRPNIHKCTTTSISNKRRQ